MEDKEAISIYSYFREIRRSLEFKYKVAEYHNFSNERNHQITEFAFALLSQEHSRELANSINEFSRHIHDLGAWSLLLKDKDEDTIFEIVIEFITPIFYYCLGAPYAIKNKLITSICEVSHQANRFLDKNWKDDINLININFKIAEKHAKCWKTWPKLCAALSELSNEDYKNATSDFRNRYNHGFHRHIEIGITGTLRREVTKKAVTYHFGGTRPFHIEEIIPILSKQHVASIECFEKYIDLINEHYESSNANFRT